MRDLTMPSAKLAQVQRLYPGAVGYGTVTHANRYVLLAQIRRMERRGEILPLRRFARRGARGEMVMPYVRFKTPGQVRRESALRIGGVSLIGLGAAYGVGWLVWESRYVIVVTAAALLLLAAGAVLLPHWSRGCPGLHCQGCAG